MLQRSSFDSEQIGKSIMSGTSIFLRDPLWKSVPWEDDPASKTPIDYLIDIGTDISEYNFILSGLDGCTDNKQVEYLNLAAQVSRSIKDLNKWWRK
jgi:hypothetical protein